MLSAAGLDPAVAAPASVNAGNNEALSLGEATDAAYQLDDFMVKHHPSSSLPNKVYRFNKFMRGCTCDPVPPSDPELWCPGFASLLEFEFAEFVEEAGLKKKHITRVLQFVRRIGSGEEAFRFTKQSGIQDRKSTRLNSSHSGESRMPSSA